MRSRTFIRLFIATTPVLAPIVATRLARAMDLRFDVATDHSNTGTGNSDADWFGTSQLPYLNFPSANGHNIEQGNNSHNSTLTAAGNTLGMYYDPYSANFISGMTAATQVSSIESWVSKNFGGTNTNGWLVLNEVDTSSWNGSNGDAYRTWILSTLQGLNSAGYHNIILYAQSKVATKTYASTWAQIAQYADVGDETYIDGQTVKNENWSVSQLQSFYQSSYNAWTSTTNGAGLSGSKIFGGEHFSVNNYLSSTYWGANGTSGADWERTIEARDIALHNIPFGGFIGYAWDKDAQATGVPATDLANQIAYERAYASTMVVQTEVPTWTGNDASGSWSDYLNWTGGLPSTTAAPFPLLAASNPNLPKQTAANFLNTIKTSTTITLDGNQSVTSLSFGSPFSYTVTPGTGGTLTLTGSGAAIGVTQGSHSITAGVTLASNVAANIAGSLTLSGGLTNSGVTLSKSGNGTLIISGTQTNSTNSAIAVSAGTLLVNSDAGSSAATPLAFSASGGTTIFNTAQHLSSVSLTGGNVALKTTGQYLLTHSFSTSGAGQLDLTQNDLIDNYTGGSQISGIQSAIINGYKLGTWNGPGIVTTSVASHPHMALGYAEASSALGISGLQTGIFDGQTVDATTVLVKYTWQGDANLDGVVNALDFNALATNFGKLPGSQVWIQGDFNYDGSVNSADFDSLAADFGQNMALGSESIPSMSIAPEPILAPLVLIPLLIRRRKSI